MRKVIPTGAVLLLATLLLVAVHPTSADEPDAPALPSNVTPMTTPQQTELFTQSFLKMLSSGNTFDAFAMMKAVSPKDAANEIDETRDTTQQLIEHNAPTMGKPVSFELIARRQMGQSLMRYECLLKLERHPLRCTIFYYKPADTWMPVQVTFDEDIRKLFEDLPQ